MRVDPELDDFKKRTEALLGHPVLGRYLKDDEVELSRLTLQEIEDLAREDEGYCFLIAAAGLNRTSLKAAASSPEAKIVQARLRKAFAIKESLPIRVSFSATAQKSVALRAADLKRKRRGAVESLLRDRLHAEGIPIFMSPPVRKVPGLLVSQRKPDGVYPDPSTGQPPRVYLEIKNVRRVSDDIQKRLYEIAEASIEMKALYGKLRLRGLDLKSTLEVSNNARLQGRIRSQITKARPVVVAFLICPKAEAEKYRRGAEAFIDRLFFQEEVEDCIEFLREVTLEDEGH